MIRWPGRALAAIRKLFEPLQDIDVYVEDEGDEVFYRELFNRACGGAVKVSRVFGLGGKPKVIEAAKAHDPSVRRALFIVDGDLDWVRGVPNLQIAWLHQHSAYCVENLIVSESGIARIVSEELVISDSDARVAMSFAAWRTSILECMCDLFACFGASNELAPQLQTIGGGLNGVCSGGGRKKKPTVDAKKVASICAAVKKSVIGVTSEDSWNAVYNRVFARIKSLPDQLFAISGKDFLLPLLNLRLQELGCQVNKRTLRMRLLSGTHPKALAELKGALELAAVS